MFEDEGVEDRFGSLFLLGPELTDGFELEAEVLVGAAGVGPEDELVGRDLEGEGQALQGLEGGLGANGLVAVDLDQGEAGARGQGLLAEAVSLAVLGQAGAEVGGDGQGQNHRQAAGPQGSRAGPLARLDQTC